MGTQVYDEFCIKKERFINEESCRPSWEDCTKKMQHAHESVLVSTWERSMISVSRSSYFSKHDSKGSTSNDRQILFSLWIEAGRHCLHISWVCCMDSLPVVLFKLRIRMHWKNGFDGIRKRFATWFVLQFNFRWGGTNPSWQRKV